MTFSNVNVFRSVVVGLRASEPGATADKITRGGAFAPDTKEAVAIMRSDIDNQWENSYIIKYQALMQNRLNRLKQELTNAYKSLLEVSSVQQVRENGLTSSNSAVTDVYGKLINNADEAFKRLTYYNDESEFLDDDSSIGVDNSNLSAADGTPSYLLDMNLKQIGASGDGTATAASRAGTIEMRKLYVTGPALQIANSMKVAFRTEEVPPEYKNINLPIIGALLPGEKGFTPAQKVAEYSADVKSGGFWTTLNYLYNFAPRELKYSYPTAYSTNTEESGSRQIGSGATQTQAVIFNGNVTDARDVYAPTVVLGFGEYMPGGLAEDDPIPDYTAEVNEKPPVGARIKWTETDANSGYQTERSPIITQRDNNGVAYGGALSRINSPMDRRVITRRESDNDSSFNLNLLARADNTIKTYSDYPDGSPNKLTYYGLEEANGATDSMDNRIKWEYNHDGRAAGDFDQDGLDAADEHVTKAIFVNHFTVQTQEVELNSSSVSYGGIKALDFNSVLNDDGDASTDYHTQKTYRSTGIDGSLEHVFNDSNGNKVNDGRIDGNGDGDFDDAEDTNESVLIGGSSKISKNFDGKFVSNLYKLGSFNGQNIATESANVNITTKNDANKVTIAEYEGFKRAQTMNAGLADDAFSVINNTPRTEAEAKRLAKLLETEINATSMVDTDWHYSEYVGGSSDKVMFRFIDKVSFETPSGGSDSVNVLYKPSIIDGGAGGNFKDVTVGFRKTFKLEPRDFQQAVYSAPNNADIYINTPTYVDRDVWVDAITTNSSAGAELIVNGKVVTGTVMGGGVIRYNLKGFLQAGDNVIGSQVLFDQAGINDTFELAPVTASNSADINTWLNGRVSTDNTQNGDLSLAKLNQTTLANKLSSWQSKIMVRKAGDFTINDMLEPNIDTNADGTPDRIDANGNGIDDRNEFTTAFADPKNPTAAEVSAANPLMLDYLAQFQKKYKKELNSLGSVETVTKVKDNNTFATILTKALNNKEYQDIFNLGLLNTNLGKTMIIKAQVSAPTGGSVNATMDIQYDPASSKFSLVQNKFDATGGV